MADLCEEPDILCQLRNVIMSGDFDELTKLTSNLESSTAETYLAPIYEELKQINVSLNEDVENYIINFLVNARFFTECTEENKDQKVSLEDITKRIDIIVNLINFLLKKYSLVSQVDDIFVFICRKLAINLHVLKHQMRCTYHKLPWEEMEFYLVAYIITITKPDQADDIFHLIIDKKSLMDYLDAFSSGLSKIELNNKTINQKLRLGNRTQIIESVNQTNSKFKTLYYHYDIIRDVASLRRIDYYINACTDLIFFYDSDIDTLMLERALQVIGEYLKSTPESPNVSENVHKMLVYSSPNRLKEIVTSLRDSLSHVDTLLQKQEIEDNQPRRFFRDLQNDLKKVHVEIRNILFKRKLAALQLFTNKILDCSSMSEILALNDNMSQVTIEDDLNIIWLKEIETVVDLIKQLESEIGSLTEQEECLFRKLRQEIMMKKNKASETMLAYQKLSMHLLTCLNEIQETNTLENVKNSFRIVSNLLSIYLNTSDFKKATYIIQSLKSSIDARLSFKNIEKVDTTINEILDLIVLKSDKVGDINRFKTKLETVCVSNKEVYVNELIENAVKCLECNKDKEILVKACDSKRSIYKTKMKLLNLINNGEISNSDSPKYRDLLKKLKIKEQYENTFIQNCVSGNMTVCKDIVSKVDDSYGNLMKKFSETNIFAYRKQEIAFKTFLTSLKLKKFPLDMVINNFTTAAKQEIKNFFTYRLKLLKTTLSVGEEATVLEVMKKFNSDQKVRIITELIVLDLMNVLESAALFIDDKLYLDDFSPLLLGKSLRNYLAHGNILIEILPFDILTSVASNAFRLIQEGENIFDKQNILIGKNLSSDVFKSKNIFQEMEHVEVQNALYSAVSHHNLFDIQALIEKGANIKGKDINGFTVLHHAASTDNLEAYMFFMSCNLDCLTENKLKQNSLDVAIMRGSNKIFEFCLQQIEFPIDFQKLICTAAKHGQIQMVKKLLDICSKVPGDALLEATKGNHKETVAILLENQHKLVKNDNYTKCLHFAALFGHLDVANILLSYGFKVNSVLDEGLTPLHCAIQNDHANIVQLLLENGAKVDIDTANLNSSKSSDKVSRTGLKLDQSETNLDGSASISPSHFAEIPDTTDKKLDESKSNHDESASISPSHFAKIHDTTDQKLDELESNHNKSASISPSYFTELHDATNQKLGEYKSSLDVAVPVSASHCATIHDTRDQKLDQSEAYPAAAPSHFTKIYDTTYQKSEKSKTSPDVPTSVSPSNFAKIHDTKEQKLDQLGAHRIESPSHFTNIYVTTDQKSEESKTSPDIPASVSPSNFAKIRDTTDQKLDESETKHDESASISPSHFTKIHVTTNQKLGEYKTSPDVQASRSAEIHDPRDQKLDQLEAHRDESPSHFTNIYDTTDQKSNECKPDPDVPTSIELKSVISEIKLDEPVSLSPSHFSKIRDTTSQASDESETNSDESETDSDEPETDSDKPASILPFHFTKISDTTKQKLVKSETHDDEAASKSPSQLAEIGDNIPDRNLDESETNPNKPSSTSLSHLTESGDITDELEADTAQKAFVLLSHFAEIDFCPTDQSSSASSIRDRIGLSNLAQLFSKVNTNHAAGQRIDVADTFICDVLGIPPKDLNLDGSDTDLEKSAPIPHLHLACMFGFKDIVEILIRHGAKLDYPFKNSFTPIHFATAFGHKNIVELLRTYEMDKTLAPNGISLMRLAIENNHLDLTEYLIDEGADINNINKEGFTALHLACQYGMVSVLEKLLQIGGDVTLQTFSGNTPLHVAVEAGQEDIVKYLLGHSSKTSASNDKEEIGDILYVNLSNHEGIAPIHVACESGNIKIIEMLLAHKAEVNKTNHNKQTPLYFAIEHNHTDIVNRLILSGADVQAVDVDENTPLHLATRNGEKDVVKVLINKGADINVRRKDHITPLHIASSYSQEEIVKELVEAGGLVNAVTTTGITPLYSAAKNGNYRLVRYLIEKGADINKCDNDGVTPLHFACRNGYTDVVELVIENGADISALDDGGATPLHLACLHGHLDIVELFIEAGMDINLPSDTGETPLHLAAESGSSSLVLFLLRNAAKNNVTDLEGFNPLHVAAQKGHEKVASSLIQSGISVNSKSSSGVTPLHMAAEGGSKHVIRFLLEKGAAVDEIESEGYTPLHIAAQYGNKDAVELLLDAGADVDLKTQGGLTAEELASQHDREEVLMSFHEEKESKLSNLRLAHLDSLKDIYKAVKIFGHGTDIEAAKNLLDSGVDANSNLDGLSLLDFAVYNCNEKMVSLLISNGADVNYQNGRVNSPLVMAADLGFSQIVEILLNNGANVNLINKSRTPLGAAVTNGHFECVKLLLNNGSDVYVRDSHDTVLHQATVCGNVDVLKLLLEEIKQKGNEDYINEKDSEGDTPLMWAIENKLYDVSKVLLDFGANVNVQNNDGMTALHWTVKVGDLDLLELLLNQPSVDVSIKNKNGEDIITVFKTKYNCSENDRAKQFLRILDLRMV